MPAIQPARLKIQTARLSENFNNPAVFVRALHELLDFYADRAYRPGQAGEPPPLTTAYNVPPPVLRQVVKELSPYTTQYRMAALNLCDRLWEEPNYEFRSLAASLLGQVSPEPPEDILGRVLDWANPSTEMRLVSSLLAAGLSGLRQNHLERYLHQVEVWLYSENVFSQHLGLQALLPLLSSSGFENLPVLFRMLTSLVRSAPLQLRPDLLDVIQLLARRSPKETAFFLRQNLEIRMDNPGTAWITRHSLAAFPPEIQSGLRAALRAAR